MKQILLLLFAFLSKTLSQDSCITDPTTSSCVNYQYTNASNDVKAMCGSMGNMPGCTLNTICSSGDHYSSSPYCEPFAILKTVCSDMGMMTPCNNYKSMCKTGSVVKQCATNSLPLPTSLAASDYITGMCEAMSMSGCSECDSRMNCDVLTVYSNLCLSMPAMTECQSWSSFCALIPDWPICSSESPDSTAPPAMRSYFHDGITDYILFKTWVPRTSLAYAGTWFAVLFISILYEGLKSFRSILEKRWDDVRKNLNALQAGEKKQMPDYRREAVTFFRQDIPRGLLRAIENGLSLLIMLIAMTFNVGLFFAILVGTFIGAIVFGRLVLKYNVPQYSFGQQTGETGCH